MVIACHSWSLAMHLTTGRRCGEVRFTDCGASGSSRGSRRGRFNSATDFQVNLLLKSVKQTACIFLFCRCLTIIINHQPSWTIMNQDQPIIHPPFIHHECSNHRDANLGLPRAGQVMDAFSLSHFGRKLQAGLCLDPGSRVCHGEGDVWEKMDDSWCVSWIFAWT